MARFEKGNPGGPGRPPGRSISFELLDRLGESKAEELFKAVLQQANDGKPQAAHILMSRIWPRRRGRPVNLTLPPIREAKDLLAAQGAVAQALSDGELTPQEAADVSSVLEKHRRMVDLVQVEERVKALEAQLEQLQQ